MVLGVKVKKLFVYIFIIHSAVCLRFLGVKGIMGLFNVLFEEIHFDRQHTLFCRHVCMFTCILGRMDVGIYVCVHVCLCV